MSKQSVPNAGTCNYGWMALKDVYQECIFQQMPDENCSKLAQGGMLHIYWNMGYGDFY